MLLSEVYIKNYRSIEELTLKLGKCSIIVGKNNSGKSNILKAIDLVLGGKYYIKLTKNDFYNRDENIEIIIRLTFKHFTPEELKKIEGERRKSQLDSTNGRNNPNKIDV